MIPRLKKYTPLCNDPTSPILNSFCGIIIPGKIVRDRSRCSASESDDVDGRRRLGAVNRNWERGKLLCWFVLLLSSGNSGDIEESNFGPIGSYMTLLKNSQSCIIAIVSCIPWTVHYDATFFNFHFCTLELILHQSSWRFLFLVVDPVAGNVDIP